MSSRLRIGIIVAVLGLVLIVLGSVAVVRLYRAAVQPDVEETPVVEIATVTVVVAARDMAIGTLVSQGDLTTIEIPVEFSTRESIATIEDAVDKILKVDVIQGEMILSHNLADPTNTNRDIAYVLSDTHVLYAFPANDLMSRNSMIKRGDIVDLFVTITTTVETVNDQGDTETTTEQVTFDSMQRLDITALVADIITEDGTIPAEGGEEQNVSRNSVNIKAYLLALDPQDALILKYLVDDGANFDMVLRAPTSTGQFNLTPVTTDYLTELYGLEILP